MRIPRIRLCRCLGLLAIFAAVSVFGQTPDKTTDAAAIFRQSDQDSDKSLSKAEYQTLRGESKEVVRDWIVFDLNADQLLSEAEFLAIPSVGGVSRGPIPDPFAAMIDRLLDVVKKQATDKAADTDKIEFAPGIFTQSLRHGIEGQELYGNADPNSDGVVSMAEARSFLEIQFGIRRPDNDRYDSLTDALSITICSNTQMSIQTGCWCGQNSLNVPTVMLMSRMSSKRPMQTRTQFWN